MNNNDHKYINDDHQLADGFGNHWMKCHLKQQCELQIVRIGKVQCDRCDNNTNNQNDKTNYIGNQWESGSEELQD